MGDLLGDLFDQFEQQEQTKIKAAEATSSEIIARGVRDSNSRVLAAGSLNLTPWCEKPENDARADAAGFVFDAYVNALWRQRYAENSGSIPEFLAMLDKIVEAVLARFGQAGEGLLADLCERCRINTALLQRNTCTEASASADQGETGRAELNTPGGPAMSSGSRPILQFSQSWRIDQKRDDDLTALCARKRHKNPDEILRQEGLLQDARAWAVAELRQIAPEVRDILELKERVVKHTLDDFIPRHLSKSGLQLGYREFEVVLWQEGLPSLEDIGIQVLAERAPSAAQRQSSGEDQTNPLSDVAPEAAAVAKRGRGRPAKIPIESKQKALNAKNRGAKGKEVAQLVYDTPRPSPRQVKDARNILRNYQRSLERTKHS